MLTGCGRRAVGRGRGAGVVLVVSELAWVDSLGVVAGAGQQQPVQRAARLQFLVRALGDKPALVEHRDPVGEPQRRAPVRDQQRGPARHDPVQGLVDLGLHPRVDRRGCVVENQDARVGEQGAGERHPLPLSA